MVLSIFEKYLVRSTLGLEKGRLCGGTGSCVQTFEGLFSLLKADLRQVMVDDELSNSQGSDLK